MLDVTCDLCGRPPSDGPITKRGALSLCHRCAGVFGGAPSGEEPGSLGAVAVPAGEPMEPSERTTLVAPPMEEATRTPTWRVPAPRLDALVRDLDGRFAPSEPTPPTMPSAVRSPDPPARPERAPRALTFDASAFGKGVMATAGIALAVIIAFLSFKSVLPRSAGAPAALALEGARAAPVPASAPVREIRRGDEEKAPLAATAAVEPAPPAPVAAPLAVSPKARKATPAGPPKPRVSDAGGPTPAPDVRSATEPSAGPAPPPSAPNPVPDFGDRE